MVVHFHQPPDNLERVVARAVTRCYAPFLEVVARHTEVKFTLHYSGCLLHWLEGLAPEVLDQLGGLVGAGQVELLTAGLEEPILAALPERDRLRQISRMNELLEARLGTRPEGAWLTERVWEPALARTLAESGVRFTIVDDTSLWAVGVGESEAAGPFVTDYLGHTLRLLGASRRLRYRIPYGRPESVVRELLSAPPGALLVYADDGEKFGEWPDTHRRVYRRGWLDRFLEGLEAAQRDGNLVSVTASEAALGPTPQPVQLPSCAYDEMMTWALPTPARGRLEAARTSLGRSDPAGVAPFARGAPWPAFLAKYPELARLQQEQLRVSAKVEMAGSPSAAVEALHLGQCNCPYWHGTFGGAYLPFLRLGAWHHLIRAERLADELLGSAPGPWTEMADFDADGLPEIRLHAPWGYATIDPGLGGQLVELVTWDGASNLVAVMGRHQESYHRPSGIAPAQSSGGELAPLTAPLVDPTGLEFDPVEVGALRDHLDSVPLDIPYQAALLGDGEVELTARVPGAVVIKRIAITAEGVHAAYRVVSDSPHHLGVEVRSCPFVPGQTADQVAVRRRSRGFAITQKGSTADLLLRPGAGVSVTWAPVVAAGATLNGVERLVQGVSLLVSTIDATDVLPGPVLDLLPVPGAG